MITYLRYKNDILVGDYLEDGGCKWEFSIEQPNTRHIVISISRKDVDCLQEPRIIEALTSLKECITLSKVEGVLREANIPEAGE